MGIGESAAGNKGILLIPQCFFTCSVIIITHKNLKIFFLSCCLQMV